MAGRGAPVGNQNAAKAKRWEAAICRALEAWPNPPDSTDCNDLMRGLNHAAYEFVKSMHDTKDLPFFRELGDRLDGKPHQSVDLDAKLEGNLTVEIVRFADTPPG